MAPGSRLFDEQVVNHAVPPRPLSGRFFFAGGVIRGLLIHVNRSPVRPAILFRYLPDFTVCQAMHRPGGYVQINKEPDSTAQPVDIMHARDCLHLMLLEFGDVHIETFRQLLRMTNSPEQEFSHICSRRLAR